jgi:hypothetical protein
MKLSFVKILIFSFFPFSVFAFWNSGLDVNNRVVASYDTDEAYYSILHTASGGRYSDTKNPIRKIDVYAEPVNWRLPWSSAHFVVEVNCNSFTARTISLFYYEEKRAKGKRLPPGMQHTQRDIRGGQLPNGVISSAITVACTM